ncbi:MFS transporter [Wukongibacter baidiensis]|uniref:MFS transporter n=1 Tax=Wukongibacter baidiensis TaxID=1723361 RepID=UPI003D7F224A
MLRKTNIIFILSAIILLIVVLGFTGELNILAFEKNYTELLISNYAVLGNQTVDKIQYSLKYGKPLDNFYGMTELLKRNEDQSLDIENIRIILSNGEIIYDYSGQISDKTLDSTLFEEIDFNTSTQQYISSLHNEKYHIFLPIRDSENVFIASMDIVFDKKIVESKYSEYSSRLINYLIYLVILAAAILVVFNRKIFVIENGKINKKVLLTSLIILLGCIQIFYGLINYVIFKDAYSQLANENANFITTIVKKDLESVISKGVSYDKLHNLEDYLEKILENTVDIDGIYLSSDNKRLYSYSKEYSEHNSLSHWTYSLPLKSDYKGNSVSLSTVIHKTNINSKMKNIILDMITMIITSFFFTVELSLFLLMILNKKIDLDNNHDCRVNTRAIRPLAFIVFTAIFMSTSFIPVVMKDLYTPIIGLSKDMVLGLPISFNFLCCGIATVLAGYTIENKGWKPVFLFGIILLAFGTFLSGISKGAVLFILARGIVGVGYGFSFMAMRGFVISEPSNKSEGFASLNSGINSGINCGVVIGAMLVDRIGYSNVFFVTVGIVVLGGIVSITYNNRLIRSVAKNKTVSLVGFLTNKGIVSLFLFIVIPTAICNIFLNYYTPLYMQSAGLSISNVSRAFLLNCLCVIYLGPILSNYFTKHFDHKKTIALSSIIFAGALFTFVVFGNLYGIYITAVLLGIADSFGPISHTNYLLDLNVTKRIGEGKALGYFSNVKKIGQMLGPMIFALVAPFGTSGVGIVGVIMVAGLLIFLAITKIGSNKKGKTYG